MGSDGQNGTYFHTESGIGEWWWVDLLVTRCVRTVVITNRFEQGECSVSALLVPCECPVSNLSVPCVSTHQQSDKASFLQ